MIMDTTLPYLERDQDRHGNPRVYVRRHGRRVRIRASEGTTAFAAAYSAAVAALEPRQRDTNPVLTPHASDTLGWLGAKYFTSNEFRKVLTNDKSRHARRSYLETCFAVPRSDDDPDLMGNCPLQYLTVKKVRQMIEAAPGHGAQANRRKHLSALCQWGVDHDHLPANPARDTKTIRKVTGGYYTWTVADVEQFRARHPIGTKPFLALALLVFTGARRQDMVTFGRQHVRDGWLRYVPKKTLYRRRTVSQKPWLSVLAEIVARSPCGALTFLETSHRKPFTANGFGNWMRDRCDEARLPQCSAHGLKKAGATIAAENGATASQLMAMFDWSTISQAKVYTDAADRKRLAGESMSKIDLGNIVNG